MLRAAAIGSVGVVAGASSSPNVSVDLTPIILACVTLLGILVTAGYLGGRYQKAKLASEARKNDADARLADGQAILTHAQYEGFIAEAAQRLELVNKAAISRLEAELARNQARIAELQSELERAKAERNEALVGAHNRERELQLEITDLRNRVVDLERRLEARGVKPRRHGDPHNPKSGPDPELGPPPDD